MRQRSQFEVTLNPRQTAIEFSINDFEGKLQTLVFSSVRVPTISLFHFSTKSAGAITWNRARFHNGYPDDYDELSSI